MQWHQGLAWQAFTPVGRGFDFSDGFLCGGEDHFLQTADLSVGNCGVNGSAIRDAFLMNATYPEAIGTYTGTRFVGRAVQYIEQHARERAGEPLFEYVALHNTHAPLQALPQFLELYNSTPFRAQREYYAMFSTIDAAVGDIVAALKRNNLWENTALIWATDNGAPVQVGGTNFPLRGGKGSNWEGGYRVPFLASGGLLPASQRGKVAAAGNPVSIVDLYSTFATLAGLDPSDPGGPAPIDSVDLWPFLSGAAPASPRADSLLVIDHNMYTPSQKPNGAIRLGKYKLLVGPPGGEQQASWYGNFSPNASFPNPSLNYVACDNTVAPYGCLFDLVADPTEHADLSAALPDVMAQLLGLFDALNATYHPPVRNPPSDEAGLCAAALANQRIVTPWRTDAPPGPESW